jgi:RHS repeat-associated protein
MPSHGEQTDLSDQGLWRGCRRSRGRAVLARLGPMLVAVLAAYAACCGLAAYAFCPPALPAPGTYGCENPASPKMEHPCVGTSVNSATGNESEEQTDLVVGGRGPGLRLMRSYNSLLAAEEAKGGAFGFGWTGPWSAHLEIGKESDTVVQDNGSQVVFAAKGSELSPPSWAEVTLLKSGSSYIYTLPNQSKLEFDSEGRLSSEADRDGNALSMTYNGSKQLEKVTDGDSRSLTFTYSEGRVSKVTDPLGHVVEYKYASENLVEVTIEKKARWKFEYNASHGMTKMTDGRGNSVKTEYESGSPHRATEQTIAGHERKFKYGTLETTIAEPNGSETVEDFNNGGLATKVTRDANTSLASTTEYEYDNSYDLVFTVDPNGRKTEYGYDEAGNRTREKDPNGDERKWKYDKTHDIETETTPKGEVTTITRNANGDPETVERTIGAETQKTTYAYDKQGDVTEETDPLKHTKKFEYDEAGDRKSETDPVGNKRTWEYNTDSQVTGATSPRKFTTKTERDEQGRPIKVTDPLGHTIEYVYDGNGNVETESDGNGHTTKYEYNEENLPIKVTEPNGDHPEEEYDSEGKMTGHTDGNAHKWKYVRNKLEEVTEEENPLKHVTQKKYDQAGNLEKVVDPEGRTTTSSYDGSNRLKEAKYSSGNPATVKYEYDSDSHVIKMTDGTGETVNTYDKIDRLTESKNGAGKLVKYEYSLVNEPTKITYPNEEAVKRAYDSDNRLEKVTDGAGRETKFSYDADSNLTATIFPTASEDEDTYGYNGASQMIQVKMVKGATSLGGLIYTRDGDGQVKTTTTIGLTGQAASKETYDPSNRLTEANGLAYTYDAANNPTKVEGKGTYAYDEADELKEGPELKYTYNNNGQRTKTEPSKGNATTYAYDQAGNLTEVKRTAEIEDSFTYDGNNLRQSQTIKGTTTHLTWDTAEALPLVLEDETSNYIYGPSSLPIEQTNKTATLYLHHDQQGSTQLLTNTSGNTETTYTYNPYGSLNASKGTATTPLRYDAQYTNTDTELIYLRARTHDPTTAQFLTIDPLLKTTGDPYTYTKDNPLNGTDPTGEQPGPFDRCGVYLRHAERGDAYARLAYAICMNSGDNLWSNCVRNCLIDIYCFRQHEAKTVLDHRFCWEVCAYHAAGTYLWRRTALGRYLGLGG